MARSVTAEAGAAAYGELLYPRKHDGLAVADIAAERDVRDRARAGVLADPGDRHRQQLGNLVCGEEARG
jgi:hypothetical protein